MSSIIGDKIKISVFGESHGKYIGVVIDGFPAGEKISLDEIMSDMERRAPGRNKLSTKRFETDEPEIISGILNDVATGAPICAIIKNQDVNSSSYCSVKKIPRPGHSDYTATVKFKGFNDIRGGGHLSGRLTAPITFAGSLCKQVLRKKGIEINARIKSIAGYSDKNEITQAIERAANQGDSVGGIVECVIAGVPAGFGDPIFDGIENNIAKYVFGIPGVKGIEFGLGFEYANKLGSESNDEFFFDGEKFSTRTNNHGGILGGISSGMPIVFRVVVKPTPSIAKEQRSVDLNNKKNTSITINGRHDPCIVPRAVVVVEAVSAIAILNLLTF